MRSDKSEFIIYLLIDFEIRSQYVSQASLELLGSNDPLALASRVARTTGSNCSAKLEFETHNNWSFKGG